LGGEVLKKRDLSPGKGANLLPIKGHHAKNRIARIEGHLYGAACPTKIDQCAALRISRAIRFALHEVCIIDDRTLTAIAEAIGCRTWAR
jgi:hypothetical protein